MTSEGLEYVAGVEESLSVLGRPIVALQSDIYLILSMNYLY